MTIIALGLTAGIVGKCAKSLSRKGILSILKTGKPKLKTAINNVKLVSLGDNIKDILLSASLGIAMTSAVSLAGIPLTSAAGVGLALGGTALSDATLGTAWTLLKLAKSMKNEEVEQGFEANKEGLGILGYEVGMTKKQVETAYRNVARQHHTDKGGDKDMFILLQSAKEYFMEGGGYEYLQTKEGKEAWENYCKDRVESQNDIVLPKGNIVPPKGDIAPPKGNAVPLKNDTASDSTDINAID